MAHPEVLSCNTCGLLQRIDALPHGRVAECARCSGRLNEGPRGSLQLTAALALAALILYVPANIYPIMRMHFHGAYSENTVMTGQRGICLGISQFLETNLRPVDHRDCDYAVERDHRPRLDRAKKVVQAKDLRPVGVLCAGCLVVHCGDRCLHLIRTYGRGGQRLGDQIDAFGNGPSFPQASVLLHEWDE